MTTVAVLPVKRFDRAKQRLSSGLAGASRAVLAEAMLRDVLGALTRVRSLYAIVVVTREPRAQALARAHEALIVEDEEEAGQSAAASLGVDRAVEFGAERVLMVPGDCPALDAAEVQALIAGQGEGPAVTIVPDRHGTGTNALLLAPPDVIAPAFGQGSCARHRAAAEASGARVAVAEVASLALDVDTPDDLDALRGVHLQDARRRHTPGVLRALAERRSGVAVTLAATALPGLPEVRPGDDLAALLAGVATGEHGLRDGDALAIAHKVVSKAEGRVRDLADVAPSDRARELAAAHAKDPRTVQVVLDETEELLRAERGVLICRTRHGFVCANAGVDASNAGGEGRLVLLPVDPDASARALRARMRELTGAAPAVVITDSFGRAWRHGQCDVAIGCAGLAALRDWRGGRDAEGRELRATWVAVADEAAAAADLARAKDSREPAIRLRGLHAHVTASDGPGAAELRRPPDEDLFR